MVSERTKRFAVKLSLYVGGVVVVIGVAFPFFWMTISSFKPLSEITKFPPTLLFSKPTLQAYKTLFADSLFLRYFVNTIYTAGVSTFIAIIAASLAAYSLTRFKFFGSKYIPPLTLLCYMLPRILLVLPLYGVLLKLRLINTLNAIVVMNITFSLPFGMWLLISYFDSIPIAIEEAALVDGCTRIGAFARVVVPLALPGIVATTIFVFIVSWNDYVYGLTLISTDAKRTLSVGIMLLSTTKTVMLWDQLLAAGTCITVPILVVLVFLQKYIISGFTAGAVKQ